MNNHDQHMNRTAEWMQWQKAKSDYDKGYLQGCKNGKNAARNVKVIDDKTVDQRTSQLLNELYHDRARLEKVIENIVQTFIRYDEKIDVIDKDDNEGMGARFVGEIAQFVSANEQRS